MLYRAENAINARVTSSTEIGMDTFERQWKTYTKKAHFFANYDVFDNKQQYGKHHLQSWYERILRSQFENSADRNDRISLIHWTVEIGNREDFIVDNYVVPFHAIIKTPIMEYWYTHTNVSSGGLQAYVRQTRRIPLYDEHKVIQPYYHTKFDCSVLNKCSTFKNCNCNKKIIPTPYAVVAECKRLAEEVF